MVSLYLIVPAVPFFRDYFELDLPGRDPWFVTIIGTVVAGVGVRFVPALVTRFVPDDD